LFNGAVINGTSGIDWDFEAAPVVGWKGSSFLPAPQISGPVGAILDPNFLVELAWGQVDAAFYSYHVIVSSDYFSLPYPGSGFSGCIGFCEIEGNVDSNGASIDPTGLDPTLTYYWTVSVNGVYKPGDWAPPGDFTFFGCNPFYGCGPY
jgi:hypothetical protein